MKTQAIWVTDPKKMVVKLIFFIPAILFCQLLFAQDSTYVTTDPQGDGSIAYVISKYKGGVLTEKYNTFENPNKPNWTNLKLELFRSALFQRALTEANPNVYSTLLKIITDGETGNADENNFLMLLNMLGMTFSTAEKAQLNGYFEENNFTIRL